MGTGVQQDKGARDLIDLALFGVYVSGRANLGPLIQSRPLTPVITPELGEPLVGGELSTTTARLDELALRACGATGIVANEGLE